MSSSNSSTVDDIKQNSTVDVVYVGPISGYRLFLGFINATQNPAYLVEKKIRALLTAMHDIEEDLQKNNQQEKIIEYKTFSSSIITSDVAFNFEIFKEASSSIKERI
mmetsp:Transcript_40965/g.62002  ORF Transcript_40965/g.62002 Transcript_40965/m.62002 type:complete len:107 (-) Transcript_40965:49-369(-)